MKIIHSVFLSCFILLLSGCFVTTPVKNVQKCPLEKGYEVEVGSTKSDIPKTEENKMEEIPGKLTGPIKVVCGKIISAS